MAEKEKPKGNSLELALAQIEKQFGKGAIMRPVSYTHLRAHET